MDNYTLILDFIDYKIHQNSFCSRLADMAFKRSAVRFRLFSPFKAKALELKGFNIYSFSSNFFDISEKRKGGFGNA